jgi:hypothetical protein
MKSARRSRRARSARAMNGRERVIDSVRRDFSSHNPTRHSSLRKHSHETEHIIIDKMGTDPTNHEIGTSLGKMDCFNTVLWQGPWIQSPVYSVHQWKSWIRQICIDVTGLSPIVIDEEMVEPADDKVHRSTFLDFDIVGCQLVLVTVPR